MILNLSNKFGRKILNNYFNSLFKIDVYLQEFIENNFIIVNFTLFFSNIFCIFVLILNCIYYKCTNNLSVKLIKLLKYFINNCGVIYIKTIQWILSKDDIINIDNISINILKNNFSDVFDNNYYHNYKYTKNILDLEFYNKLDNSYFQKNFIKNLNIKNNKKFDVENLFINVKSISSGSIAQIYEAHYYDVSYLNNYYVNSDSKNIKRLCIKIVHPYIYLQCFWSNLFLKILFYSIYFFKKDFNLFNIPFDYNILYKQFLDQCNMKNEYENLLKFYNNYYDNKYIIIPKPLYANNNILIMKYEEGEKIDNLNESQYTKNKIMMLLNIFNYDCLLHKSIFHCDLHEGNWKLQKFNNFYKLVLYDFGYCQIFNNNDNFKYFLHSWMCNDISKIINYSFELFIKINEYEREKIFNESSEYLQNILGKSIDFLTLIKMLIFISNKYGSKLNNEPFNIILSFILIEKNLKKFFIIKDEKSLINYVSKSDKYNNIKQNCFNNISFCKEYKIFNKMIEFYEEFITINDNKFENNFQNKNLNKSRKKKKCKENNQKNHTILEI